MSGSVTHMNTGAKRVLLGAPAMTVAAVLALVLAVEGPANSQNAMQAAHHHPSGIDASSSAASPFHAEMADVDARMHDAMAVASGGDIDRDFMRMMIPHHQGAIDMALILLKYGHDEKLKRLAQSIIVEQGQEIAYMRQLLDAPAAATAHHEPHP
jgi:uncharacterized protein (DUF305 family)